MKFAFKNICTVERRVSLAIVLIIAIPSRGEEVHVVIVVVGVLPERVCGVVDNGARVVFFARDIERGPRGAHAGRGAGTVVLKLR